MKRALSHPHMLLALRLVIGGLFVYAGGLKFLHPVAFADSIATYQLLPEALLHPVALLLPPLEIIAGAMLISGYRKRLATFTLVLLCLVFLVALGQGWARGLEIDCGCFGSESSSEQAALWAIGRDILFLLGLGWLYWKFLPPTPAASHA
ncbi:MAG: MauE/DoxX family redox-associated membrane protein [Verrucomicrobiota bacterium]